MAPFRRRIGALQVRLALIAGQAVSAKTTDRSAIDAGYAELREQIEQVLADIDQSVEGQGLGYAEDCRRALTTLRERLPAQCPASRSG